MLCGRLGLLLTWLGGGKSSWESGCAPRSGSLRMDVGCLVLLHTHVSGHEELLIREMDGRLACERVGRCAFGSGAVNCWAGVRGVNNWEGRCSLSPPQTTLTSPPPFTLLRLSRSNTHHGVLTPTFSGTAGLYHCRGPCLWPAPAVGGVAVHLTGLLGPSQAGAHECARMQVLPGGHSTRPYTASCSCYTRVPLHYTPAGTWPQQQRAHWAALRSRLGQG